MEKLTPNIPIVRHFDDIDDLAKFGRDGELVPGQEQIASQIAKEIFEEAKQEGKNAIMFVCSSKKRSIQTADLVAEQTRKFDSKIKTRVVEEDNLSAMYQGEFVLPPDYKAGEPFTGLSLANKIYNKEAFDYENANDLYKFGDPVLQQDGSYKYPELAEYFKSYGESNKDVMTRIYQLLIETSEKFDKLNSKTKMVVITHAQLYQIFRNLSTVAKMIKTEDLTFNTGELPRLCWRIYSERPKEEKQTYEVNFIPIEDLCDSQIIELLKNELEYLKNLT